MSVDRTTIRHDMRFINKMLNAWDFIGVAEEVGDECDCLVPTLTRMLIQGSDSAEVVKYLRHEIDDHFGMKDEVTRSDIEGFAALLFKSWGLRHNV